MGNPQKVQGDDIIEIKKTCKCLNNLEIICKATENILYTKILETNPYS